MSPDVTYDTRVTDGSMLHSHVLSHLHAGSWRRLVLLGRVYRWETLGSSCLLMHREHFIHSDQLLY